MWIWDHFANIFTWYWTHIHKIDKNMWNEMCFSHNQNVCWPHGFMYVYISKTEFWVMDKRLGTFTLLFIKCKIKMQTHTELKTMSRYLSGRIFFFIFLSPYYIIINLHGILFKYWKCRNIYFITKIIYQCKNTKFKKIRRNINFWFRSIIK